MNTTFDIDDNSLEVIKDKMDVKGELVNKTTKIFSSIYSNAVKPIYVSQIVNGEIITPHEDNIFIDEDIDTNIINDAFEKQFEKMCKCTPKTLYDYQKLAIKKLVQLEQRGYNINRKTQDKIISNGWLLSLPIGAGKSIVFEFLAIFFQNVPMHPIIISTDGQYIDKFNQAIELNKYPFYYENCGYIERDANSVVVMKNYRRRDCTVILTHGHLIDQMQMYFEQDFPSIFKKGAEKLPIRYVSSLAGVDVDKLKILVIEATAENVRHLVKLSYSAPFMRVIIDDYTSMNDIGSFREILASSTIFVSGSKFQRDASDIPASYYTLKHVPVNQISVVGHPEDTLQGVFRDNIATLELMGNSCEFNTYSFVNTVEMLCKEMFKSTPSDCYPIIRTEPKTKHYLSLMFIISHLYKVKNAILNVETALSNDRLTNDCVSYYLSWKEMLKDSSNPPPKELRTVNGKQVRVATRVSMNPLYEYIYVNKNMPNTSDGRPVVSQHCYICGANIEKHQHYGMISTCCGAFICSKCSNSCTTKYIVNSATNECVKDEDNCYCVCCRAKNPTYIFNINHRKDSSNVHSYHITQADYDTTDLKDHQIFDYYFYMFMKGFKPRVNDGKPINIKKDVELGVIPTTALAANTVPTMDRLLPVDHLALLSIYTINYTLHELNILPTAHSILLIYNCPIDMQDRVKNYFKNIATSTDKRTMLKVSNDKSIQPLSKIELCFKSCVSQLIGLHKNIIGIIQWVKPNRSDEVAQLIGRCLRLNNFNNKLYFYITTSSTEFE